MADQDNPDIKINAKFMPDSEGEMRTVMLGAGGVGILVVPQAEGDDTIRLDITAGGFDTPEECAALLHTIAVTLDPSLETEALSGTLAKLAEAQGRLQACEEIITRTRQAVEDFRGRDEMTNVAGSTLLEALGPAQ